MAACGAGGHHFFAQQVACYMFSQHLLSCSFQAIVVFDNCYLFRIRVLFESAPT